MNQLMQSQMFEGLEQITKDANINIQSLVPAINQDWVKGTINEFLEKEIQLSQPANILLEFHEQPVKHKIIKCKAQIETNQKTITVSGEGIDEYEAVNDLINNLDIELKLSQNNPLEGKQFFFSNLINDQAGGGQYA